MFYFKFLIPTNEDGTTVSYSQGWCGTRPKCAQNEQGIYYNDNERWGIGQAEGDFVPPDVQVITEKEAVSLMFGSQMSKESANIQDAISVISRKEKSVPEGVYYGQKLADRWIAKEELVAELPSKCFDTCVYAGHSSVCYEGVCETCLEYLKKSTERLNIIEGELDNG